MIENRPSAHPVVDFMIGTGALIGLCLVLFGAWSLTHAGYLTWQLYNNPETIISFAQSLKLNAANEESVDLNGLDPFRLLAWPFVISVLLLLGKIGMWCIEAGVRLLATARRK